ncbi:MAG: sugar-binding domain-containing protein [Tropicimonas sp.]|uniref:sugar-binding domain-containing protein n=1 Tax=Tropicimonas sp. TaxID=2067044 RepID=UPI003A88D6D4
MTLHLWRGLTEIAKTVAPGAHAVLVVGAAAGPDNPDAPKGALSGRIINGLITDEDTAGALLT